MKKNILPFALLLSFCWQTSQAQWTNLGSGITASPRGLAGIFSVNENVIWGFTWNPNNFLPAHEFTRTTDGGQTWQPGTLAGVAANQFPIFIFPLDDQTAWVATADEQDPISGRIYKTTDGGSTWAHQSTGFTGFNETPAGVWFWNENEGFAYGATCYQNNNDQIAIYTTADGGANWTKVAAPAQLPGEGICLWNLAGFFSVVGDTVWFGTNKNRIFRSTDRGHTWEVFSTPFSNPNAITSVTFKDSQTGLALAYSPFQVARSTDGGANWSLLTATFPPNSTGAQVEYVPGTKGTWLIVSSPTQNLVSYNDGDSWEPISSNIDVWAVEFLDARTGFAGSYITNPARARAFKWSGAPLGNRLFVNDDATGANDGRSWADAFTDLQSALAIAQEGDQIWVAEGTYKPAATGGNQAATFLIDKNLQLYGGFAGTEVSLSERGDPAAHPTVFSGDLNGDDVDDDFTQNRSDNVLHVLRVAANISQETLIDGFTIESGHADDASDQSWGGGMLCFGKPVLRQCIFQQNFALGVGGAMQLDGISSPGVVIENCQFNHNQASVGGGINSFGATFLLEECSFSHNSIIAGVNEDDGGGMYCTNSYGVLKGCTFTSNSALDYGGGFLAWTSNGFNGGSIELRDCIFDGNTAGIGESGVSLNAFGNNPVFSVSNCTFIGNTAVVSGGGLAMYIHTSSNNASFLIDNCDFLENHAAEDGSGFFATVAGKAVNLEIKNCHFQENTTGILLSSGAADFWGTNGATGMVLVDNCLFENNESFWSGALEMGNGYNGGASLDFTITNSTFKNNQAREGGAVGFWSVNPSTSNFTVSNCLFEGNTAEVKGGAIHILPGASNFQVDIRHSKIIGNQSPDGEAIDIDWDAGLGSNFPANASCLIENSLIAGNTGGNAAISVDSLPTLKILNSTIADNAGGGIQLADKSGLTLQNTIFHNPGFPEYTATTADVTFTSNGGNLIHDLSLDGKLIASDQQNADPLFAAPGDYHLTHASPAVDAGVSDGVTALTDLDGNPRIQGSGVDAGAFESEFDTPTKEAAATTLLAVSPNPATDFLRIELPENVGGAFEVEVLDAQGRLLRSQALNVGQRLNLQGLTAGMYSLKVVVGERVFAGKFVKQ